MPKEIEKMLNFQKAQFKSTLLLIFILNHKRMREV